jgi:hypothetical protein
MKPPEALGPLDKAYELLKNEVQRAISLYPNDEAEAICEVLRRSHDISDLRRVLQIHGATVAVGRATGNISIILRWNEFE